MVVDGETLSKTNRGAAQCRPRSTAEEKNLKCRSRSHDDVKHYTVCDWTREMLT